MSPAAHSWRWTRASLERRATRLIALGLSASPLLIRCALPGVLVACALTALPAQAQDDTGQDPPAEVLSVEDVTAEIARAKREGLELKLPATVNELKARLATDRARPRNVNVKALRWIGTILAVAAFALGVAVGGRVVAQLILGMWFTVGPLYSIAFIAPGKVAVAFTLAALGLIAIGFALGHHPRWRSRLRGAGNESGSWIVFGTGSSRYAVQLTSVVLACVFADNLSTWAIPIFEFFNPGKGFQSEALYATSLSAGVATGALLVIGPRVWPAIAVGTFVGIPAPFSFGGIGPVLIMTIGQTVGSLVCWWLVNRYAGGLTSFPRVDSVVRLTGCALASAAVVALFSIVARLIGWEMTSPFGFGQYVAFEKPLVAFLRIFVGIILAAPVITLWSTGAPWRRSFRRAREFTAVLIVTGITAWWVFCNSWVGESHYPIPFLALPVLLWPAFRLGVRETVTASLVLAVVALTGSGLGYGPFVLHSTIEHFFSGTTIESLLLVQLFLVVCALSALAVAAEVGRREAIEGDVRALNADLERRAGERAQELVRAHARLRRTRVRHRAAMRHVQARIASDLHDSVGASLSRIAILSDIALRESAASATLTTSALTKIGDNARAVIDEMGDAVWFVDPRMEDIQQMVVRLRTVANALFEPNGTDWNIDAAPEVLSLTLTSDQRRHLFLILKEALTNVHRHAHATRVRITMTATDSGIRAVVDDNGTGVLPDRGGPGHGNGVANIQKRARELDGTLSIQSRPEVDGTRIVVDVPLRHQE